MSFLNLLPIQRIGGGLFHPTGARFRAVLGCREPSDSANQHASRLTIKGSLAEVVACRQAVCVTCWRSAIANGRAHGATIQQSLNANETETGARLRGACTGSAAGGWASGGS